MATPTKFAIWLDEDELGTIEFALEEIIMSECCEGHQESAVELYEYVQMVYARMENEVRFHGEP